jgi:hypothetical protein
MKELILALAVMKSTDLAKELIPFPVAAWVKSVFSLVTAGVLGLVAGEGVVEILGIWGGAALTHEITAVLAMISDDKKQQIILRTPGRRR